MSAPGYFHVCKRTFLLLVGLGLWAAAGPALWAQPVGIQQKPQVAKCYVKNMKFNLPLNMSQQTRNNVSEIHLYCLNNANGKWVLLAKCPPNQTGFNFDAHGEGEFWFTLCMVDMLKRVVPADPAKSEYKMCVVVDMTPPLLDAQFVGSNKDGYIVQVDARDAHIDPNRTVLEYQTLNQDWRAIEPMGSGSNRYCIPVQAAVSGLVRVSGADLAENAASKEFDLPLLKRAAQQVLASIPGDSSPGSQYITLPTNTGAEPPVVSQSPAPIQIQHPYPTPAAGVPFGGQRPEVRLPISNFRPPTSDPFASVAPSVPVVDVSQKVQGLSGAVLHPRERNPALVNPIQTVRGEVVGTGPGPAGEDIIHRINGPVPEMNSEISPIGASAVNRIGSVVTASASSQASPLSSQRRLINQRQLKLDYRVDHVGASGVGKVEVWITNDQSQSWQKLGEDVERKSPVVIELPGEGLYGITIVVSNGRGFGGAPPNPGDAPDSWVEVDMTRPAVEIKEVRPGGTDDPGTVHITWTAQDRNLAPDPVDLYYATSREGNWSLIAKGLRSDGRYRWVPPTSVGSQLFIRVVARDLAGNATVMETAQPFAIDDMSRPRVRLIGISPVAPDIRLEPIGN